MKRVLITNAGQPSGLSLTRALHAAPERIHVVGVDADPHHLQLAEADEVYLVPHPWEPDFAAVLHWVIQKSGVEMAWPCGDEEIAALVAADDLGARTFLPRPEVVALCQNKMDTCARLAEAGVPVPRSMRIYAPEDLQRALGLYDRNVWLRAITGTAGRGALPVSEADLEKAKTWITLHRGWGSFMASERLPGKCITWESVWQEGRLVFSQGSQSLYWEHSNMTLSGVTGIVGALRWIADVKVDSIGEAAVEAVAPRPHGIFTVDMTYDTRGNPRVTEINAGRFAQTGVTMFAAHGVNIAYGAAEIALQKGLTIDGGAFSSFPTDTVVIRGIDVKPVVLPLSDIEAKRYATPYKTSALSV